MDARLTADDVNLSTRPSCWAILQCECAAHTSSSSLKSIHFCFKGIFESKVSALTASNQKTKKSGIENGFGSTRERRQKEIFSQQTYNRHKSNECPKENRYKFNLIHLFKVESKTDSLQKKSYFPRWRPAEKNSASLQRRSKRGIHWATLFSWGVFRYRLIV